MTESPAGTPPKWYMPVSIIALLWNLMGLMAFAMYMSVDQAGMDAAEWTAEQQEFFKSTPMWVNAAFAVGVIFGVSGSIDLILRRKFAIVLLGFSMVGVLAQCTWIYFLSDAIKMMGIGLSPVTIVVSIALVALAIHAAGQRWLR